MCRRVIRQLPQHCGGRGKYSRFRGKCGLGPSSVVPSCSSLGIDSSPMAAIVWAGGSAACASPFRRALDYHAAFRAFQQSNGPHTGAIMTARGAFYLSRRSCPPTPEPHIVLGGYRLAESRQNGDVPKSLLSHRQNRFHREADIGIDGRGSGWFGRICDCAQNTSAKAVVKWLVRQVQSTPR
jgi:hypothetical protein